MIGDSDPLPAPFTGAVLPLHQYDFSKYRLYSLLTLHGFPFRYCPTPPTNIVQMLLEFVGVSGFEPEPREPKSLVLAVTPHPNYHVPRVGLEPTRPFLASRFSCRYSFRYQFHSIIPNWRINSLNYRELCLRSGARLNHIESTVLNA